MNNDDMVRRVMQRAQRADDQQLAEKIAKFEAFRTSVYQLVEQLRRDVSTFVQKAEDQVSALVEEHRHEVGVFRKRWVVDERSWAGWYLVSWEHNDGGSFGGTDVMATAYILIDGSLLLYDGESRYSTTTGPVHRRGRGREISPDELLYALIGQGPGTMSLVSQLRSSVTALYQTAGLPLPALPQAYGTSKSDLNKVFQALRISVNPDLFGSFY